MKARGGRPTERQSESVPSWGEELAAEARAVRALVSSPLILAKRLVVILEERDDKSPALGLARQLHETLGQEG